jgi:hypothetical protein
MIYFSQEFVFWNLPQIQFRNPQIQIVTMKNLTPSPFVTCYLEKGDKVIFDVDGQVIRWARPFIQIKTFSRCEIE